MLILNTFRCLVTVVCGAVILYNCNFVVLPMLRCNIAGCSFTANVGFVIVLLAGRWVAWGGGEEEEDDG